MLILGCGAVPEAPPDPSPSPSPTEASTPTATPQPTATLAPPASPSPTATATPEPAASPSPTPTPSPAATAPATPAAWSEPLQLEGDDHYDVSLAVDETGAAQAAVGRQRRIVYLTNDGGAWAAQEVTSPGGGRRGPMDTDVSIALAGTIPWIAMTRFGPEDTFGRLPGGVALATMVDGSWSIVRQINQAFENSPSLVMRGEDIHLAYIEDWPFDFVGEGLTFALRYFTEIDGVTSDVVIVDIADDPILRLDEQGRPWFAFNESHRLTDMPGPKLARPEETGHVVEHVAAAGEFDLLHGHVLDSGARPHVVWSIDETPGLLHSSFDGTWVTDDVFDDEPIRTSALGIDGGDALHVVAAVIDDGVWYTTNRGGAWASEQLSTLDALVVDIAVGPDGRAHVMFIDLDGALWYVVGPGGA